MEVVALLAAIVLLATAGIIGLAQMASNSDVHRHSGSFTYEHTGTIRHEVAGTVQHTVQHVGTVQHEHTHRLDPSDRARLDQLVAQRELSTLEHRQRVTQHAEVRRVRPVIEG